MVQRVQTEKGTYYESAEGVTLTPHRAAKEIESHGLDPHDFFEQVGDLPLYDAQAVLLWIGY